jgi:hypothetical protein
LVWFDYGDTVMGHCQHERAAIVPVNIDLRPIVMLVNFNNGPERSNGYRTPGSGTAICSMYKSDVFFTSLM